MKLIKTIYNELVICDKLVNIYIINIIDTYCVKAYMDDKNCSIHTLYESNDKNKCELVLMAIADYLVNEDINGYLKLTKESV